MMYADTFLLDQEHLDFISKIEDFIQHQYPTKIQEKIQNRKALNTEDFALWQNTLHKKGWGAPQWPKEHGGPGWSELKKYLFYSTLYKHDVIIQLPFGPSMLAPVVMAFGTEVQKKHYLPKILTGEHIWCQGYSEPNAGSDLASLQMRAERKKDHYLLNGAKIWTTCAQFANHIFCLVRTDPNAKPQEGISFMLVDMQTPGVNVTPIITSDREHEVNQVTFDDVKIPLENLVGEENKGWNCAKYLLTYERSSFGARLARTELEVQKIIDLLTPLSTQRSYEVLAHLQDALELQADITSAKLTMFRAATSKNPGYALKISSIIKIISTRIIQQTSNLALQIYQEASLVHGKDLSPHFFHDQVRNEANLMANRYLNQRKESIYAGSNEIQMNIIAKMILGL